LSELSRQFVSLLKADAQQGNTVPASEFQLDESPA
jgi:hypothetical protein